MHAFWRLIYKSKIGNQPRARQQRVAEAHPHGRRTVPSEHTPGGGLWWKQDALNTPAV